MLSEVPEDIYFSILEFCDSFDHARLMTCNRGMLSITANCAYRQFIELFDPPKDSPVVPQSLGDLLTMVNVARRSTRSLKAARDACNVGASYGLTKFIRRLIGNRKWAYGALSGGALTLAVRGGHSDTLEYLLSVVNPVEVYSLVNPSSKASVPVPAPLVECASRATLVPQDVRTGEMAKLLLESRANVVGDPSVEQNCPVHLLVRKCKDTEKIELSEGYLSTARVMIRYLANQCAIDYRLPVVPAEGPGFEHQRLVEVVTKALSSACYWQDDLLVKCIVEGFIAYQASRLWLRSAITEVHSQTNSETLNASNGYRSGTQSRRNLFLEGLPSPLFLAATAPRPERAEKMIGLLLKVCDPNVVLPSGKSPLYLACENGAADGVIRVLLLGGAKVDTCTCTGRNALFAAVEKGHFAAVETLCSTGRCVNLKHITQRTNGGVSPFMLAENKGRLQMMLAMLEAYAREARISLDTLGEWEPDEPFGKLAFSVTHPYLNKMCHKYRARLAARADQRFGRGRSMKKLTNVKARPKSAGASIRPKLLTPRRLLQRPLMTPRTAERRQRR
ncbi:hypothetical protein FOZ62_020250 [Perkinsus olseni]|uniref:Uncharacterized protein n=1 Tax=Perkinsus olseni TaxID=32597 RepID=A0A7J6S816_PEROL|nr:hypothetical protein FOZ62_020250 [Perkinsus olseni]